MPAKPVKILGADHPISLERSEAPYEAVAAINNHLAFYPDRVGAIEAGADED